MVLRTMSVELLLLCCVLCRLSLTVVTTATSTQPVACV